MIYKLPFEVRDNEVDIQGVVNNANYFNYFAHARHQYAKSLGLSFAEMSAKKQYLLLIKTEVEFKKSLMSEDCFDVTCQLVPCGKIRFAFEQTIIRLPDGALMTKARNICVCVDGTNKNRPYIPDEIRSLLV